MSLSDQEVLRRWLVRRDPDAFRAIVQRHAGMVYATCRRILRNDSEAEEVAQDCFETLVRTAESEQPLKLGPWLHGMATNKCLMRLRAESRRRRRETEYAAAQRESTGPRWNDIYSYVDEAIAELPEEIRSPLVAHYLCGQSHGGIARATGVPRRTVSNRIKRGLELLGKSLRKRGIPVATSALTAMMAAHLTAEAAPATLTAALGKLALAHSASAGAGVSVSVTAGKVLGSMLTVKQAIAGVVAITAVIGGLWVTQRATREPREESGSLEQTLPVETQPVADEPELRAGPLGAEEGQGRLGAISGTVSFADSGEPASGVVVKDYTYVKEDDWTGIETVTDETGKYMLTGLTPGISHVVCVMTGGTPYRAAGSPEIRFREGETRTDVDILLVTGGSISGKVLDESVSYHPSRLGALTGRRFADDGALMEAVAGALVRTADGPLPGVKIVLAEKVDRLNTLLYGEPGAPQETITDANGHYTFMGLRPGPYVVRVEPPEGAVQAGLALPDRSRLVEVRPNEDRNDVDFSFRFDGVSIRGRVTDSSGEPVQGAAVVADPWAGYQQFTGGGAGGAPGAFAAPVTSVNTLSNEDGRYQLDGLGAASLREAWLFLQGYFLPRFGQTFAVGARADGYVPAQVLVPAVSENLARDARASLEGLKRLYASMGRDVDGEPASPIEVVMPTSRGNVISLDIVLENEAVVMGRLIDTRGDVVPKSRLRMVFADPPDEKPIPLVIQEVAPDWTETDEEGQFFFDGVPAGIFLFEAETKGLGNQRARNAPLEVRAGEFIADLEVILEAAEDRGNIEGRVIAAATGAPVEDFSLGVIRVDAPEEDSPRPGKMTIDKPNGTFRIEGVSAGVATLELKAPGYARERIQVNVEPGRTTPVRFELATEGILRGHVMRNGQPSANGYVTIPNVEHSHYTGTNEDGYYELKELKAGTYLVNFTMWLYEDARGGAQVHERLWVEVASGHETQVDIDYQGHGVIHGTFDGPEEDKWMVRVFDSSLPRDNQLRATTWKFKPNGRYEIIDLPHGTYTVVGVCTGEDGAEIDQSKTVSLGEGDVAEVNFEFE